MSKFELHTFVEENDLGDEMFSLLNHAIVLPSSIKGAEELYPKFIEELNEGFFEDFPDEKIKIEENKEQVLKGLVKFIKHCKSYYKENYL